MSIEHWDLIAKKLSGGLSSEEEKELTFWLNINTKNQHRLKEAENIWKISDSLRNDFEPNTEKAWQKLKEQIENSGKVKPLSVGRPAWLKIAAAIAAVVMISFLVKYIVIDIADTRSGLVEVITTDSVKVFYLSDKTRISLNKHSRFFYPEKFIDSLRIVTLVGEAFFEVEPNRDKPFIIHADQTETRVVGTSFNIKAYEEDEDVQVIVVRGKVKVEIKDNLEVQPVMLEAGDEISYYKKDASVKKQKTKNTDFMWWKKYNIGKEVKQLFKKVKKEI